MSQRASKMGKKSAAAQNGNKKTIIPHKDQDYSNSNPLFFLKLTLSLIATLCIFGGIVYIRKYPTASSSLSNTPPTYTTNDAPVDEIKNACSREDAAGGICSLSEAETAEWDTDLIPKNANPEGKPREAVADCVDRHKECAFFQRNGECLKNPGWMIINCPASCDAEVNACELRDPNLRCNRNSLNMSTTPIYQPGDMNAMFNSIVSRFSGRYDIKILSTSPWVVIFDNFVTDSEADALFKSIERWERSTDTGMTNEYGETGRILSTGRTSSNGWCIGKCEQHPKVRNLFSKIEEVTNVPRENYESFQVLQYEVNQKYNVHHDYGAEDIKLACGPRILTFFLYLSDVEEGGETAFPTLNIQVKPKKGRALLWPSTLDANPELIDSRTMHEAKPVIRGKKIAANAWIHLYNYERPNLWGCTGNFEEL